MGVAGRAVSSTLLEMWGLVQAVVGAAGHPLFRPFSRLIALSLLGPAYQISFWSVFDIRLLCEPVWNTLLR